MRDMNRRKFVQGVAASAAALAGIGCGRGLLVKEPTPLFRISLAEWSLHRALKNGEMTNLDFPAAARRFGIEAVEYVNTFFKEHARDTKYLAELNRRCADAGVRSVLIMCDREGDLGDPDAAKRAEAVENHMKWAEAAEALGCHSIRVNARSSGTYEEQMSLAADGLAALTEQASAKHGLNVIVENHGGLSSNGAWLAGVMRKVGHPRCGTLPDFGNFNLGNDQWYDRYKGVEELMPYAKGVSAKSHTFDEAGNEVNTDYFRMMKIVLDAGYHGYVGVEYEGDTHTEHEGIALTKNLLEKIRAAG